MDNIKSDKVNRVLGIIRWK